MAAAQQPDFSTGVKVVNVYATVRDKEGQLVKDLKKEDFHLLEDGRPQAIRYFTQQSDLPLTLGLLVDTSFSERRMIPTERTASRKFLELRSRCRTFAQSRLFTRRARKVARFVTNARWRRRAPHVA